MRVRWYPHRMFRTTALAHRPCAELCIMEGALAKRVPLMPWLSRPWGWTLRPAGLCTGGGEKCNCNGRPYTLRGGMLCAVMRHCGTVCN